VRSAFRGRELKDDEGNTRWSIELAGKKGQNQTIHEMAGNSTGVTVGSDRISVESELTAMWLRVGIPDPTVGL
jgi:hypothetical protein